MIVATAAFTIIVINYASINAALALARVINYTPRFVIEGKSAASFCHQVATLVPEMFCNFYLVKNQKIANKSTTTKTREKISADL
jgi:hypothetical protein